MTSGVKLASNSGKTRPDVRPANPTTPAAATACVVSAAAKTVAAAKALTSEDHARIGDASRINAVLSSIVGLGVLLERRERLFEEATP